MKKSKGSINTPVEKIILEDHKPLKKLLKIMKNDSKGFEERVGAFEEFAPLLTAHAKAEEEALYTFMKENEDLRQEGFEGDVEHTLADQMVEEADRTSDEDVLSAKIKVLAELVEHHIEEEESELLPKFKRHADKQERVEIGQHYLELKRQIEAEGSDDSPHERDIPESHRESHR